MTLSLKFLFQIFKLSLKCSLKSIKIKHFATLNDVKCTLQERVKCAYKKHLFWTSN